jgi:hypothetical protein
MNCFSVIIVIILLLILMRCFNRKLIWFYDPNCGFCRQMESEWSKLETLSIFTFIPPLSTRKVDITKLCNLKFVRNFNVSSVPHIVRINRDGSRDVYTGSRKALDIWYWATS